MLIFFIIPGFAKNAEDKYDEEEQETLAALQDFILYPIRQIIGKAHLAHPVCHFYTPTFCFEEVCVCVYADVVM